MHAFLPPPPLFFLYIPSRKYRRPIALILPCHESRKRLHDRSIDRSIEHDRGRQPAPVSRGKKEERKKGRGGKKKEKRLTSRLLVINEENLQAGSTNGGEETVKLLNR